MVKGKFIHAHGVSLVEVLLAAVIVMVAALAAVGYRYSVALDTRKAQEQMHAARLGVMLLEGWKGWAGRADFAPEINYQTKLNIAPATQGTAVAGGFDMLNRYKIVSDGVTYHAMLSSKDATPTEPKTLNVKITWSQDRQNDTLSSNLIKSIRLTTYAGN